MNGSQKEVTGSLDLNDQIRSLFGEYLDLAQVPNFLLREALEKPEIIERMLHLLQHPEMVLYPPTVPVPPRDLTGLIHGRYRTTELVNELFLLRCEEERLDPERFLWLGSPEPPRFDARDPEVVVLLEVTCATMQQTLLFIQRWQHVECPDFQVVSPEFKKRRWRDFVSSTPFTPFTRRWRCVKLDGKQAYDLSDLKRARDQAGLALLYLPCQHPERCLAHPKSRNRFWIGGIRDASKRTNWLLMHTEASFFLNNPPGGNLYLMKPTEHDLYQCGGTIPLLLK